MSWLVKLLDILLALNNHLTVDFLIKPTISYRGRLVPQLSGHSTLLFEQREAVCSSKDSLVIFLPHCWQGSLCFAHCAVCAAILSLATISPQPSLAHAVWNFPHVFKCCSCSWNFPFHRKPLLLHLTSKFPVGAVICKLRGFEVKRQQMNLSSTGKGVLCPREASSLSLSSATLTARSTRILVKSETTSKDTNSSQALRVLSLMKSANSQEFLTV